MSVETNPCPPVKRPDQTPKPRTSAADAAGIPNGPNPTKGAVQEGNLL